MAIKLTKWDVGDYLKMDEDRDLARGVHLHGESRHLEVKKRVLNG